MSHTPDDLRAMKALQPKLLVHLKDLDRFDRVMKSHPQVADLLCCLQHELALVHVAAMPDVHPWTADLDRVVDRNPASSLVLIEAIQACYNSEFEMLKVGAQRLVKDDGLESVVEEIRKL